MTTETKRFSLRTVLSCTTGRLLTESKGPKDNGIDDLYKLYQWMTGHDVWTHQLGRVGDDCKPFLLRQFPELEAANLNASDASLSMWLDASSGGPEAGIKLWICEMQQKYPAIRDEYDVPQLPPGAETERNPIEELVEMVGPEKIVVIGTDGEES
jgi:hypothetical protein